jgi:poly-gamma-glutamate capsule biosynthesis protein CapA/YwtB (metallophosphatase superfamily)
MGTGTVRVFLCGDVMLGRGVDRILPHPGNSALRETYVKDAEGYVRLAEDANGPIPRPVSFSWPWGEALRLLDEAAPDVRVVNLETSITRSDDFAPGKAVHYRMSPANLPALAVARPDVCALANNHVLDFGRSGLAETLDSLARAHLCVAGAGRNAAAAWRPAAVPVGRSGRVLVFSFGSPCSGVPPDWAATADRPGVAFVPDLSPRTAAEVVDRVRGVKRPGDIVIASVHWGSNWGYEVFADQVGFAHALVDGGVDVVHGHSSHHPRPAEVYRDRLVLYGCGDLVDDYEGISGYERYRDDLRLLYLLSIEAGSGRLAALRMLPAQSRRMRLHRASRADTEWLRDVLDSVGEGFGARVGMEAGDTLALRWARSE